MPTVGRQQPFFVLTNDVIDDQLGMEAVAVYAYIVRHGRADAEDIARHFGVRNYHIHNAMQLLLHHGFITVNDAPYNDGPYDEPESVTAPAPPTNRPGWIYVIKSGDYYKIGKSKRPARRATEFSVQLPQAVEVILTFEVEDMNITETQLHQQYAHKHVNGEWFALDANDLATIGKGI